MAAAICLARDINIVFFPRNPPTNLSDFYFSTMLVDMVSRQNGKARDLSDRLHQDILFIYRQYNRKKIPAAVKHFRLPPVGA